MADRIIVVGGGGFGRELMCWLEDCTAAGTLPPLAGFLDDSPLELPRYAPRLGSIQDFTPRAGDLFALAIAKPETKRKITGLLKDRGGRFVSVVHPSAIVVRTAHLGEGVVLYPQALVTSDSSIGNFVTILNTSSIGHDSILGDFSTISALCNVMGNVTVGADVFLGSGARLLPNIKIGDGASIGAGVTALRSVKSGNTLYAAPPKILKFTS